MNRIVRAFWESFSRYLPLVGFLLFVALVVALAGCGPAPLPPIVPADVPDGACQAAQDTLDRLGCEERATPGGTPFVEACEDARADGRSWCPVAISLVSKCSQVEAAAAGELGGC